MIKPALLAILILNICWLTDVSAAKPENPVRLTVGKIDAQAAIPGDTVFINIPVTVANGFHVNANPASSEDYIPLEVTLEDSTDFLPAQAIYPKGKKWRLEGTTEDLLVYSGQVTIRIPLIVKAEAKPGERVIKGSVDFQACDNQVCFMPESRPISLIVRVADKH